MATRLKGTDVVMVGMGAAGGLACLPLANAGIEIIGIEAGPDSGRATTRRTRSGATGTGWAVQRPTARCPRAG